MIFVYSNLFTNGSISTWRVTERFFAEHFGFLFDNMSRCYLVFASDDVSKISRLDASDFGDLENLEDENKESEETRVGRLRILR